MYNAYKWHMINLSSSVDKSWFASTKTSVVPAKKIIVNNLVVSDDNW